MGQQQESGAVERLTDEQRQTLNAAEQILVGLLVPGEVLMFSIHHGWDALSTTYFSPSDVQYGSLWSADGDNSVSGKIDRALAIRADEAANADKVKAERVERLRKELADLTSEVAA